MKLLLLGGPKFLGRAVADAALGRGHELTFFNRGQTNPELYPDVERLVGDRERDLESLDGRSWDAVIDTCGYLPRVVEASVRVLAGSGLYCFVSSVSVYADLSASVDEESATAELGDLPDDEVTGESFGPLKARCEDAVRAVFGRRALVVRPGLIVGPHDPSGRFTYWPHRIARGGEVLAPAPPARRVQIIDVRDLADWMVSLCENGVAGTFNAAGEGITWGTLLATCQEVAGTDARTTWVPDEFLVEHEVGEWIELPLWLVSSEAAGFHEARVDRARDAGLRCRPLAETVRSTLELAEPTDAAGLAPEREAALLAAWHGK